MMIFFFFLFYYILGLVFLKLANTVFNFCGEEKLNFFERFSSIYLDGSKHLSEFEIDKLFIFFFNLTLWPFFLLFSLLILTLFTIKKLIKYF
jgi:hypothetical protein